MSRKRQEKRNQEREKENSSSARYVPYKPKKYKTAHSLTRRMEQELADEFGDILGFNSLLSMAGIKRYY